MRDEVALQELLKLWLPDAVQLFVIVGDAECVLAEAVGENDAVNLKEWLGDNVKLAEDIELESDALHEAE